MTTPKAPDKPHKVVDARNENRVLMSSTDEDSVRDFVEANFPRHHVDPAAPTLEHAETDVVLVLAGGGREAYLGPESGGGWVKLGAK
jgi:hypothetical protein